MAAQAHQLCLQRLEPARLEARLPQAARGVEQVEMGRAGEREARTVEPEARVEQGHVEHLAVEGDQPVEAAELRGERVEQRTLLVVVAHEELAHAEALALHPPEADQERRRAGSPGEARRLGVEEHRSAQVEALELGLGREHADRVGRDRVDARQRDVAVPHLEVHGALHPEALAPLVLDPHPVDELLERDRRRAAAPLAQRRRRHQPLEPGLERQQLLAVGRPRVARAQQLALEPLQTEGVRLGLGRTPQSMEAVVEIHSRDPRRADPARPAVSGGLLPLPDRPA